MKNVEIIGHARVNRKNLKSVQKTFINECKNLFSLLNKGAELFVKNN